jgi:hypothetical protein
MPRDTKKHNPKIKNIGHLMQAQRNQAAARLQVSQLEFARRFESNRRRLQQAEQAAAASRKRLATREAQLRRRERKADQHAGNRQPAHRAAATFSSGGRRGREPGALSAQSATITTGPSVAALRAREAALEARERAVERREGQVNHDDWAAKQLMSAASTRLQIVERREEALRLEEARMVAQRDEISVLQVALRREQAALETSSNATRNRLVVQSVESEMPAQEAVGEAAEEIVGVDELDDSVFSVDIGVHDESFGGSDSDLSRSSSEFSETEDEEEV